MSLIVRCPCGFAAKVPEHLRGKRVRCKSCGQTLLAGFGPIDVAREGGPPAPGSTDAPSSPPAPGSRVRSRRHLLGAGILLAIGCALALLWLARRW